MKKIKNKISEFFTLTWKKFVISTLIFVVIFFYRNRAIKIFFESIGLYPFFPYLFLIGIPLYLLISFFNAVKNRKKIRKRKKTKNNFDKFLLLDWRKIGIFLIAWIIAVVIHNLIYAFSLGVLGIEFEEAFFFIIAVIIIPVYFIISVVYTLINKVRKRK